MKTLMCVALLVCVFMAYASAFPEVPIAAASEGVAPTTAPQEDLSADESAWYGNGRYGWGGYHGGYGGYRGGWGGYNGGWGGYGRGYGWGRGWGYGGWGR